MTRVLVLWSDDRSTNLGVRALAAGTAAWCRRALGECEVVFHNYGATTVPIRLGDPKAVAKELVTGRAGLLKHLRQFDLVIDTRAGDSFADIYGLKRLFVQTVAGLAVARSGVPVVLGPQTIGPFGSKRAVALAKLAMRSAAATFARDTASERAAADLGRPVDVRTTDVVFCLDVPSVARTRDVVLNVSGLLWQPNPHVDHELYRRTVAAVIEGLRAQGRSVALLAHVIDSPDPDNDVPAVREAARLHAPDAEILVPTSLGDVREMVASAQVVIGSRMHACLNSLSVGTPAIPLAYSRKFAPLLGDLGFTDVVDLRSGAEAGEIWEQVRGILADPGFADRTEQVVAKAQRLSLLADDALRRVVAA